MVSSINMNSLRTLEMIQYYFHNAQDQRSPDRYQSVPVFNQAPGLQGLDDFLQFGRWRMTVDVQKV